MYSNGYGGNQSYNAAQAFSAMYAYNVVGQMASYNGVTSSFSTPGLPTDTFRQTYSITSNRFYNPVDKAKLFMKDLGSLISSIGMVSKIVSFFYPPAAVVSTVTDIAAPTLTLAAGDTTPKPVVFQTQQKYNPWIR